MAILKSSTFGDISKSVGNVTFSSNAGKTVIRKKVTERKNRNITVKQFIQQKRFKYTSEFFNFFQPGLDKAYPNSNDSVLRNNFIKINKDAVSTDAETLITQIDFSKFLCSDGDLFPPVVNIKIHEEKSVFTVEYFKQTYSPQAYDEDDVYVMFLDPRYNDDWQNSVYLGKRSEPKSLTFELHKDHFFSMAYVFAVAENGKRRSPSVFMHLDLAYDYFEKKSYPEDFIVKDKGKIIQIPPTVGDLNVLKKKLKNEYLKRSK